MNEFEERSYIHIDEDTTERNYRETILKPLRISSCKYPDLSEIELRLIMGSFLFSTEGIIPITIRHFIRSPTDFLPEGPTRKTCYMDKSHKFQSCRK